MPVRTSFAYTKQPIAELREPSNYVSQAWKRLSRRIRANHPVCMYCEKDLAASVDHINGNSADNRVCNLASSCASCHCIKTNIFEGRGRTAECATLYELYSKLAAVRPIPPLVCTHYSPLVFLSCLLDNRRRTHRIDDILFVTREHMQHTSEADASILCYLTDPSDLTFAAVCEKLNVKSPEAAYAFTTARYLVTQKIA